MRILFLGSSSLYFYRQPEQITEWIAASCGTGASCHWIGEPRTLTHRYLEAGYRVQFGLDAGETLAAHIASRAYRVMVVLIACEHLGGEQRDTFVAAIARFAFLAEQAGTLPIWFEHGWERTGPRALATDNGRRLLRDLCAEHGGRIAPCRTAWDEAFIRIPEIDLQEPEDRVHPGRIGTWLNLASCASAIAGTVPAEWPRRFDYAPMLPAEAGEARRRLDRCVAHEICERAYRPLCDAVHAACAAAGIPSSPSETSLEALPHHE